MSLQLHGKQPKNVDGTLRVRILLLPAVIDARHAHAELTILHRIPFSYSLNTVSVCSSPW